MSKKTELAKITKKKKTKKRRKNPADWGTGAGELLAVSLTAGAMGLLASFLFPGFSRPAPPRVVWYCPPCGLNLEPDPHRNPIECDHLFCPKCRAPMQLYGRHERPNKSGVIDVSFEPLPAAAAAPRMIEAPKGEKE